MATDDPLETLALSAPWPYGAALMQHAVIGGCSIYRLWFPRAGLMSDRHLHTYQHVLLIAYGAIRLSVRGTVRDLAAPAMVRVAPGWVHDYTALVDGTVCYCIVPEVWRLTPEQQAELAQLEMAVGVIESVPADAAAAKEGGSHGQTEDTGAQRAARAAGPDELHERVRADRGGA